MPALRPESGSAKWLKYMKENIDQTTFGDLVDFPELLRIYVKHMKKKGNAKVAYVLVVFACVLMVLAYVLKVHVYVLMVSCVCPHAFCVSGKTKVGVWGPPELVDLCWRETFGSFCTELILHHEPPVWKRQHSPRVSKWRLNVQPPARQ